MASWPISNSSGGPDHPIYLGKIRVDAQSLISSWDLLGPFHGPFPQSLDQLWIDESRANAPLPPGLAATWRLYHGDLPLVDFLAAFARNPIDNAVAYALATIHADTEMPVTLRYGSDDGIAIWLNGERLVHEPVWRAAELDQGAVEARLRAGANLLLVKVNQVWSPWQFVLRATDERGDRPPGLSFSTPLMDGGS